MPESRAQHKPGEVCPRCQVVHLTPMGTPACVGHLLKDRNTACRRPPVSGHSVCRRHGAGAPQNKAAAEKRLAVAEATRQLAKLGVPIETDPLDALIGQLAESAGAVVFYRERLQDLRIPEAGDAGGLDALFGPDHTGDLAPHILLSMWNEERERFSKLSDLALRAGVAERQVRVIEQQATLFADLMRKVLDDPSLGLTETQRQNGRRIAAGHLRLVGSG